MNSNETISRITLCDMKNPTLFREVNTFIRRNPDDHVVKAVLARANGEDSTIILRENPLLLHLLLASMSYRVDERFVYVEGTEFDSTRGLYCLPSLKDIKFSPEGTVIEYLHFGSSITRGGLGFKERFVSPTDSDSNYQICSTGDPPINVGDLEGRQRIKISNLREGELPNMAITSLHLNTQHIPLTQTGDQQYQANVAGSKANYSVFLTAPTFPEGFCRRPEDFKIEDLMRNPFYQAFIEQRSTFGIEVKKVT